MRKALPPREVLNQFLSYDPHSGELIWKRRPGTHRPIPQWNGRYAGKPALNCLSEGYRTGRLPGLASTFKAHRVIWKMTYGTDPEFIDHINGDRSDNRLCNLRDVGRYENAQNRPIASNNTSGANGVYWFPLYSKWTAIIACGGKRKNLGYFSSKSDAIAARKAAEIDRGFLARRAEG